MKRNKTSILVLYPRYLPVQFCSCSRHPPQTITPPLIVSVVPINDNRPVVTLATSQLSRNETAPPILVFQDLTLSDFDYTPCNPQGLVAARVLVETIAKDSNSDILAVRACKYRTPSGMFQNHWSCAYSNNLDLWLSYHRKWTSSCCPLKLNVLIWPLALVNG